MSNENLTDMELQEFEGWGDVDTSDLNEVNNEEVMDDNEADINEDMVDKSNDDDKSNDMESEQDDSKSKASKESVNEAQESNEDDLPENFKELGLTRENGEIGKVVKIDGKEQFVSLKDLGNDYSGQKALQRRFNEVDKEKKEFESQIEQVNQYINDLGETLKGQNGVINGLGEIARLVGISPAVIRQQAIQELIPEINRLSEMDEDARSVYFDKLDIEYNKQLLETEQARINAGKSKLEAERSWSEFKLNHNIDNKDFEQVTELLRANNEEVTQESVLDGINTLRSIERADAAIAAFDSKLGDDEQVMDTLVDICLKFPELSQEDLISVLEESFGKAKEDNVKEKIKQQQQTKKPTKKEEPIIEEEFLSWDDV